MKQHNCHIIIIKKINRGKLYIDSPDWIKKKKEEINPTNKKKYAVAAALNQEEIKRDLQRITKIKPFMDKYNWERIN